MNALFRWLEVDRVQWGALVKRLLQIDFGNTGHSHQTGQPAKGSKAGAIRLTVLFYVFVGISPAMIAYRAVDPLFGGAILSTMVGFIVVSTLLVGEGATILSPNDHKILGFRPITSRTYLAVRFTTIAVRTLIISTCVSLLSVAVFLFKGGLHPGLAVAALGTSLMTGLAVTLGIVAMYGWLLRLAGPTRMLRWASYMQFAVQMLTWAVFVLVTQDLGQRALAGLTISGTLWTIAYPGAWFGSYLALADGNVTWMTLLAAVLSVALMVALGRTISGKLSLGYSETLGSLATAAAPAVASRTPAWVRLLGHESRAVSILVRSHLKHDTRFRLGLISLLPITIIYMMMGGKPTDPFMGGKGGTESMVLQMALFFLPLTLRRVLVTSEMHRASWIFIATPADRAKLVLSSRNLITLFFLVPYLLFLFAVFAWAFGHVWHAALHTVFVGMLSYLTLQFMVMVGPQLPFSLPHDKETRGAAMFVSMFVAAFIGIALYLFLRAFVYQSGLAMLGAAVAFVGLGWVMDRVTRRRAQSLVVTE